MTYLDPNAIWCACLYNSYLVFWVVFSCSHFIFFIAFRCLIDVISTKHVWYANLLTTNQRRTKQLIVNKSIKSRFLHPSYLVSNYARTGVSLCNTAATFTYPETSRMVFFANLQNTNWGYLSLPQVRHHVAWHILLFQSLRYRRNFWSCTNGLRLIGLTLNLISIAWKCSCYSRPSLSRGPGRPLFRKVNVATNRSASNDLKTFFSSRPMHLYPAIQQIMRWDIFSTT